MKNWPLFIRPGLLCLGLFFMSLNGNAQDVFRARIASRVQATATRVSITGPTAHPTWQTTEATIIVSGDQDSLAGSPAVTWACSTCTPTSATATTSTDGKTWTTASLTLAVGANVFVVTKGAASDTLTITRAASDTENPVLTISTPTTSPTYATSTASHPLGGTVGDNVGGGSLTVSCPTATPDSVEIIFPQAVLITYDWLTPAVVFVPGVTVCTVTALDGAANSDVKVLTVTYTQTDITDPVVTKGFPSGATHTSTTPTLVFTGTASDAVAVTSVRWVNTATTAGACAGGNIAWSCTVTLAVGASNVVDIYARDEAGNENNAGTARVTVTYIPTLTITTTTLSSAINGNAYSAVLAATGGVSPYTWSESGSALGTGNCAGLALSAAGVLSGTPTVTATCAFTAQVTDTVPTVDTQALTLVIRAPGSAGSHDYYNDLCARSDVYTGYAGFSEGSPRCYSMRTQAQLDQYVGFNSGITTNQYAIYDTAVDAARVTIPTFIPNSTTLAVALGASDTQMTVTTAPSGAGYNNNLAIRLGTEVVTTQRSTAFPVSNGGRTQYIIRGQAGTTAASHAIGTAVDRGTNSLPNPIRYPINTIPDAAQTYLFTWDARWDTSWLDMAAYTGQKSFQLWASRIWFEPQVQYDGNPGDTIGCPTFTLGTHIGCLAVRSYNKLGGSLDWSVTPPGESPGFQLCSEADCTPVRVTNVNSLMPRSNEFVIWPLRWTRFWVHVTVAVNGYDTMTMYVADEAQAPVLLYDRIPASMPVHLTGGDKVPNAISYVWVEFDSSENKLIRFPPRDLVAWTKNLVVLKNPPADWSALRVQPVP